GRVSGRYCGLAPRAGPYSADHADIKSLTGSYQISRRGESSLVRVTALVSQLRVRGGDDASLMAGSAAWPFAPTTRLHEIGPRLFRAANGRPWAFENHNGQPAALYIGPPVQQWQRVPWYADARLIAPLVGGSLLIAIVTLLAWPVAALVRRIRKRSAHAAVRRARAAVHLAFVLEFAVALATTAVFVGAAFDLTILGDRLDPALIALYAVAWLAVVASIFALWRVWQMWRTGAGGPWTRLHHTFQTVA